jgi:hypothetical protein
MLLAEEGCRHCYLLKRPSRVAACQGGAPSKATDHRAWQGERRC